MDRRLTTRALGRLAGCALSGSTSGEHLGSRSTGTPSISDDHSVMTATSVVELLRLLEVAGVFPWVDGGWGVDALLGHQTRPHADLDIVIPESAVPAVREALTAVGFTVLRNWLPTALAMRHADGREVDLHPITPTEDGGGEQRLFPPEPPFHYDAPTTGVINGTQVTCVDAATQLRAHVGYHPQPQDHADVVALATRFRLPLPPGY
jgi:lincosamide nucleotidyltransferase A/C/D/E